MSEAKKSIVERLNAVMKDVGGVGKHARAAAQQGGYEYRSIDDVMAALQPALIKHGVAVYPYVNEIRETHYTTRGGAQMNRVVLLVTYTFRSIEGEEVISMVTGEGSDVSDKACNKALAGAMKYAITQTLSIPTAEIKDSEAYDDEPQGEDVAGARGDISGRGKPPQRKKAARKKAAQKAKEPEPPRATQPSDDEPITNTAAQAFYIACGDSAANLGDESVTQDDIAQDVLSQFDYIEEHEGKLHASYLLLRDYAEARRLVREWDGPIQKGREA